MKKILITRRLLKACEEKASKNFETHLNDNDELYSQPKVINLSTDASTYQLTNVQPGIVYQIELVVTFENGAMYR